MTRPSYDTYSSCNSLGLGKMTLLLDDQFSSFVYMLSYFGLVDAKIRASDKDLPVLVVLVGGADRDGPPCEFKLVVVDIEPAPWSI